MIVDILHLEDGPIVVHGFKRFVTGLSGLNPSYRNVENLAELQDYLKKGNGARLYLLDGSFPRVRGGEITRLFSEAVKVVRGYDAHAKIILMSTLDQEQGAELARQENAEFIKKSGMDLDQVERILVEALSQSKPKPKSKSARAAGRRVR